MLLISLISVKKFTQLGCNLNTSNVINKLTPPFLPQNLRIHLNTSNVINKHKEVDKIGDRRQI